MQREDCVELGYIAKGHGLKGEVKAVFDVHDIHEYGPETRLFLAKGDAPLQAYVIERMRVSTDKQAVVKFEGVDGREEADALRGSTLFFPEAELPALEAGHFYYFEVIGFRVKDAQLGELGTIKRFVEAGPQDLLVMDYQGKEVLIPMNPSFVGEADLEAEVLHTQLPPGLLDVYLGE